MIDFLINWALNLAPKTHQKSIQEAPEIDKKGIENIMQVGLEFGPLLGRFLVDIGVKLGGKLDPSWQQNPKKGSQNDANKMIQKMLQKSHLSCASCATQGGGVPINHSNLLQDQLQWTLDMHFVPFCSSRARWRIYIYAKRQHHKKQILYTCWITYQINAVALGKES